MLQFVIKESARKTLSPAPLSDLMALQRALKLPSVVSTLHRRREISQPDRKSSETGQRDHKSGETSRWYRKLSAMTEELVNNAEVYNDVNSDQCDTSDTLFSSSILRKVINVPRVFRIIDHIVFVQ